VPKRFHGAPEPEWFSERISFALEFAWQLPVLGASQFSQGRLCLIRTSKGRSQAENEHFRAKGNPEDVYRRGGRGCRGKKLAGGKLAQMLEMWEGALVNCGWPYRSPGSTEVGEQKITKPSTATKIV